MIGRTASWVVVAAFAAISSAGCGGSGGEPAGEHSLEDASRPAENVVRVAGSGGVGITAMTHWIAVQAATDYSSEPSKPVPSGVVPDPPLYGRCIAQLRAEPVGANPQNPNKPRPKPTTANLKRECEHKEQRLRQHILLILTSFQWLAGEAARQGVKVSDAKVKSELERFRKGRFPTTAAFQEYLRNTGQTYDDELLRMRMDLYSNELARHAGERAHATSRSGMFGAYLRVLGATARRWEAKTTCRLGYVTQNCSNYKGTLEPELRI